MKVSLDTIYQADVALCSVHTQKNQVDKQQGSVLQKDRATILPSVATRAKFTLEALSGINCYLTSILRKAANKRVDSRSPKETKLSLARMVRSCMMLTPTSNC